MADNNGNTDGLGTGPTQKGQAQNQAQGQAQNAPPQGAPPQGQAQNAPPQNQAQGIAQGAQTLSSEIAFAASEIENDRQIYKEAVAKTPGKLSVLVALYLVAGFVSTTFCRVFVDWRISHAGLSAKSCHVVTPSP